MQHVRHEGPAAFYLEDLIGSKIVSAEGKHIGRVVDVRIATTPNYHVTGLLYGGSGWLNRLHVFDTLTHRFGLHADPHIIPWDAVTRFEHFTVTLKQETNEP